jgi:HK97 family phage portal protein
MAFNVKSWFGWFGGRGSSVGDKVGEQVTSPSMPLVPDTMDVGTEGALQISAVWSCVDRRASVVASLPFFAYSVDTKGQKELARQSSLYTLLHSSPNSRMTPFDFWRAMVMWYDLRGNAYARIDRSESTGEATALWPLAADQVRCLVLPDSSVVYEYRIGADVAILAEDNVLHIKGLGNGTAGLAKMDYMRTTTHEAAQAQGTAARLFSNGGKPTGVLMVDKVLNAEQRKTIRERFSEMAAGPMARLFVLEASMKYEPISLTPEQQQLLSTRQYGVEEICRWFDVPPVLVHHANVTTWGSGVEQIMQGFYKLSVRPMLVNIEQAVTKRVLTASQRARMSVEFGFEALLRADPAARSQFYSTGLQNGWVTRNEVRQLENLPRVNTPGGDLLTAQSNLLPIDKLGQTVPTGGGSNAPA